MRKYLLRWCYHFNGSKPSVRGQWSPGGSEGDAASVSREGLRCAVIEAKDIRTREVFPLYECDGQDFVIFQWIATQSYSGFSRGAHSVDGLRIIARDQYIEAMVNGDVNPFPISAPNFNFQSLKR